MPTTRTHCAPGLTRPRVRQGQFPSRRLTHPRLDQGSASVELTLLFPLLIAALFLTAQLGLAAYARSVALGAAQDGARAGSSLAAPAGAGQASATAFLARAGSQLLADSVVSESRGGAVVTVTVTGRTLSLVPGFAGFTIRQSAILPIEKVS